MAVGLPARVRACVHAGCLGVRVGMRVGMQGQRPRRAGACCLWACLRLHGGGADCWVGCVRACMQACRHERICGRWTSNMRACAGAGMCACQRWIGGGRASARAPGHPTPLLRPVPGGEGDFMRTHGAACGGACVRRRVVKEGCSSRALTICPTCAGPRAAHCCVASTARHSAVQPDRGGRCWGGGGGRVQARSAPPPPPPLPSPPKTTHARTDGVGEAVELKGLVVDPPLWRRQAHPVPLEDVRGALLLRCCRSARACWCGCRWCRLCRGAAHGSGYTSIRR